MEGKQADTCRWVLCLVLSDIRKLTERTQLGSSELKSFRQVTEWECLRAQHYERHRHRLTLSVDWMQYLRTWGTNKEEAAIGRMIWVQCFVNCETDCKLIYCSMESQRNERIAIVICWYLRLLLWLLPENFGPFVVGANLFKQSQLEVNRSCRNGKKTGQLRNRQFEPLVLRIPQIWTR